MFRLRSDAVSETKPAEPRWSQRALITFAAALATALPTCGVPGTATRVGEMPAWSPDGTGEHLCFAYSPEEQRYACHLFGALPAPGPYPDVSSGDFESSLMHARSLGALIMRGVAVTSNSWSCTDADGTPTVMIVEYDEWNTGCDEGMVFSEPEVARELERRGYVEPVVASADLPSGVWVPFGRVELRYGYRLSETDASFEYWGTLEVRCEPGAEPVDVFTELLADDPGGAHLGGPLARVSTAEGTTQRALTIERHDGGEGYVDVEWQHWVFDEREVCD